VAGRLGESVLRYATHGLQLACWCCHLGQAAQPGLHRLVYGARDAQPAGAPTLVNPALVPAITGAVDTSAGHVLLPRAPPSRRPTTAARWTGWRTAHTFIPTRAARGGHLHRRNGRTPVGIADKFGIKPETVRGATMFVLKDDPHLLIPRQVINILPVDGTYHLSPTDNTLDKLAKFYGVKVEDIVDWAEQRARPQQPGSAAGVSLIIPAATRADGVGRADHRPDRALAGAASLANARRLLGRVATGTFVYRPTTHTLSGYDYTSIHTARFPRQDRQPDLCHRRA